MRLLHIYAYTYTSCIFFYSFIYLFLFASKLFFSSSLFHIAFLFSYCMVYVCGIVVCVVGTERMKKIRAKNIRNCSWQVCNTIIKWWTKIARPLQKWLRPDHAKEKFRTYALLKPNRIQKWVKNCSICTIGNECTYRLRA